MPLVGSAIGVHLIRMWMEVVNLVLMILFPAIWLAFCAWILRHSDRIAARLCPQDSDASQLIGLGYRDVQLLGYTFIGAVVLVQSFPQVVSLVVSIWSWQVYTPQGYELEAFYLRTFPTLVAFAVQFGLGLMLFLRPERVLRLSGRAQGTGEKVVERG